MSGSILFFSGGSALKGLARALAQAGAEATHIVSTFDSGGSTAELRRAFGLPAVGDLRLRLSSLAACAAFEHRLGPGGVMELASVIDKEGSLAPEFRDLLNYFCRLMPPDFRLQGAALGNLILTGDYLKNGHSLYGSVQHVASVLGVCGRVLPVSEDVAHLAVRLEDGELLLGQHSFTGKGNFAAPSSAIREMFFCRSLDDPTPIEVHPGPGLLESVAHAKLICYPIGSFYSSVLANLQVSGVGQAVKLSLAKKLYMPNPGPDPESSRLSLEEQLEHIWGVTDGALDILLVDAQNGRYNGGLPHHWCAKHGVKILERDFVLLSPGGRPQLAPQKTADILLAMTS